MAILLHVSTFFGHPQGGFNKEEYNKGNLLDISTFSPIFRENSTENNTIMAILLLVSTFFGHPHGGFNKEEYNNGNPPTSFGLFRPSSGR